MIGCVSSILPLRLYLTKIPSIIQRGILPRLNLACNLCLRARRTRPSSSLANSAFTSFFFHNGDWAPPYRTANSSLLRGSTNALTAEQTSTPSRAVAYKEAEILTPKTLLKLYAQLSKSRLTILVVLTAMSGVALSPIPTTVPILLSTAIGTTLCSASAMALNQLQEIPLDAQMARTRMRPLVRRAISPLHATGFAIATGIAGPVMLWNLVNPTTAMLGVANIVLYAGVYTWMKRKSIANTWVGAVVGALPPLMGWTACGGSLLPSSTHPIQLFFPHFLYSSQLPYLDVSVIDNPLAPFALFMFLFSWQFPHFNSISYLVRGSYAQAGYQMLSVLSPKQNALVALRHSLLLVPICSVLIPLSGITTWTFALTALIPNAICVRAAWRFWKFGGEKEARAVWRHSLWYMPILLGFMMFHKKGMDWLKWLGLKSEDSDEKKVGVEDTAVARSAL